MEKKQLIYGMHPIMEAIQLETEIAKVYLQKGIRGVFANELSALLKEKGIPVQYVPLEKIESLARNMNHQGIVAFISEIKYHSFITLTEELLAQKKTPFILLLDRITDVRNIGAIARTAECAGVDAIVIPSKGIAQLNADAIKTSAGALLNIPICREENLKTVLNFARQLGFQICAATEKAEKSYLEVDFTQPTLLLMGAEDAGISNEYARLSTIQAKLPIVGKVASLNVSVAAGVFIYEMLRQRNIS